MGSLACVEVAARLTADLLLGSTLPPSLLKTAFSGEPTCQTLYCGLISENIKTSRVRIEHYEHN